jgi:hypothetical protein
MYAKLGQWSSRHFSCPTLSNGLLLLLAAFSIHLPFSTQYPSLRLGRSVFSASYRFYLIATAGFSHFLLPLFPGKKK